VLIDVHAHFYTERSLRADWSRLNRRRLEAGQRIGITAHIASILGSWGARSPVYFPSPDDVEHANRELYNLTQQHSVVFGYCVVNPNYTDHALAQIDQWLGKGFVGIKLAASRRANDALLDPVAELAAERGVPMLHHVWQQRRRDWPGQEASDASELAELAQRHPRTNLILAHLGGGGDWAHSLRVVRGVPNVWVDLSGSGIDVGMIEQALDTVGAERLLWGADVTLDTGWAKLRYLESLQLSEEERRRIEFQNARDLFTRASF
jgi:predicted TIM-barrel fold metal-dependent hydrolase